MSSLTRKRIAVGVGLLINLFFVANYYLGLGVFGQFSKKAMVLGLLIITGAMLAFGPTWREMQEHREKKNASWAK